MSMVQPSKLALKIPDGTHKSRRNVSKQLKTSSSNTDKTISNITLYESDRRQKSLWKKVLYMT